MTRPRATITPMALDDLFTRIEAERSRQDHLRAAWLMRPEVEYMSDLLGQRYQMSPWLPSDALAAATMAGADDETFGALAEASGDAAMANGGVIEQGQIADLQALMSHVIRAHPEEWGTLDVETGQFKAGATGGGGWWNHLTDNPVTRAVGNVAEGVGGVIPGVVRSGAKGAVRGTVGGLQSGLEVVTNRAAGEYKNAVSAISALREGDIGGAAKAGLALGASLYTGAPVYAPSTWQATTAGQAVSQLVETGEIDSGSGFFVSGGVQQAQAQRAREVRGTKFYNPVTNQFVETGTAWTLGRAVTSTVLQPGSKPYAYVSGTIDAAVALGLDPANYVGAGVARARRLARSAVEMPAAQADMLGLASRALAAGDEAEAARLVAEVERISGVARVAGKAEPEWLSTVQEAAGMLPAGPNGVRNAVYTPRAMRWVLSTDGRKVVRAVRDEASPTRLWLAHGRKIDPDGALALSVAETDADVLGIYAKAFTTGQVRDLPTPGHWPGNNLPGMSITTRMADRYRIFGVVPESTLLPADNPSRAMANLYDTLGNAGITGQERIKLVDGWVAAKATGKRADEFHAVETVWKAIGQKLVDAGTPEDLARAITDGKRAYGRITDFLTNDWTDGVELDFLSGSHVPTRLVEGLNSDLWLMEPSQLRAVRQTTSRWGKVLKQRGIAYPKAAAEFYTMNLWKPSVLIRPAYLTRVNGEEVVRALLGGEFRHATDMLFAMVGNGSGSNLFSRVIRKVGGRYGTDVAGDPTDLGRYMAKLDDDIDTAQAAAHKAGMAGGDSDEVQRLIAERVRIEGRIRDGFENDYKRAMVGVSRKKATATALREDYVSDYMVRTGNWTRVRPDRPKEFVDAWAVELGKMHSDPVLRRVANGGLLEGDKVAKGARPGIDGIEDWIVHNGDGIRDELVAMYPDVDFTDAVNVRHWLNRQVSDVAHHTGMNDELRQIVATGRVGDKAASDYIAGKLDPSRALKDNLAGRLDDDYTPEWVRMEQSMYDPDAPLLVKRGKDLRDELLGKFFGSLYGRTSDYLARAPTFKKYYWKHVDDFATELSPAEAQKVLVKLDRAKLAKADDLRLRAKLNAAKGELTLDDIDSLAKGYALDDTNKLLYDASRRSQFFDVAKILFPFGEAWKEIFTTWSRVAYQRPEIVNSLRKVIVSGRQGDPDQNGQGFFYTNAYGDEVFGYPYSGALAEMMTGVNVGMEGSLLGLSLGTNIMPGIGPAAAWLVASIVPNTPAWDDVTELLFPFGGPEERGASPLALPLPGWAQKVGAAIPGMKDWFGLDNPQHNLVYANTLMETYSALAASGKYDLSDPADIDRLDQDARDKAKILSVMRGVVQATGPASPSMAYKVATLEGDVLVPTLAKDFREMQADEAAGGYDTAVQRFIDKYGEGVFIYLASKSQLANPGVAPTDEFNKWAREHGDLIDKYSQVGAYFGPAGVEFNIDVYNQQTRAGRREPRTPNERRAEANNIVAKSIYYTAKEKMPANPTAEQKLWLSNIRDELTEEYPGFILSGESSERLATQLAQLEQATNDREVQKLPAGEALLLYMDRREKIIAAQQSQGISPSSARVTTSKKGRHLREDLRRVAADLVAQYPEFGRLWENVLSRELPDEEVEVAGATA